MHTIHPSHLQVPTAVDKAMSIQKQSQHCMLATYVPEVLQCPQAVRHHLVARPVGLWVGGQVSRGAVQRLVQPAQQECCVVVVRKCVGHTLQQLL